MTVPLTIGQVAARFGVLAWQVRRLFESGKLPEPPRMGVYRAISPDDLPVIKRALQDAGYLKGENS